MHRLFPTYTLGHFINQPTNQTEFEVLRFEHMDEPAVDDLHCHTFYQIIFPWPSKPNVRKIPDKVG